MQTMRFWHVLEKSQDSRVPVKFTLDYKRRIYKLGEIAIPHGPWSRISLQAMLHAIGVAPIYASGSSQEYRDCLVELGERLYSRSLEYEHDVISKYEPFAIPKVDWDPTNQRVE